MRKITTLFLLLAVIFSGNLTAQIANVQIIHNSPDALVDTIDVWVNNTKVLDNVAFREASPYLIAPAGSPIVVTVQPKTSIDTLGGLYKDTLTLTANESYVVVANGILSATGYSPAPAFGIDIFAMARDTSLGGADSVDVLIAHGSTDAGTVDIYENSIVNSTIVDDISYGNFAGYLQLDTLDYELQVRNQANSSIIASYSAPLRSLGYGGEAITVLASGFLDPSVNSNGEAFGLYVARPAGGSLIALPSVAIPTAKAQIIHNSPDTAARFVDIYLNDNKIGDNVEFRTATAYLDVQAGVPFVVSVSDSSSTDTTTALFQKTFNLMAGQSYQVIAEGIVSATGYSVNEPFDLNALASARDTSFGGADSVDVVVYHGSTDAGVVDVYESSLLNTTIVDDLAFGNFTNYLELDTLDYELQVRNQSNSSIIASYSAPLRSLGLGGQGLTVLASGFLDPSVNSNGEAFGLYVALPAGGALVALPSIAIPTAKAQIIHNSPDTAARFVDIYLNENKIGDNVEFRIATAYLDVQAGVPFVVSVSDSSSTDTTTALFQKTFNLMAGQSYQVIAEGIVSATGYSVNEPFDLNALASARDTSFGGADSVDVVVYHGSTDAGVVDVYESSLLNSTIVDDLGFGNFTNYLELDTLDYELQVRNAAGSSILGVYSAPLRSLGLGGQGLTVLASGFLDPSVNSNGEAFGLYVALPAGGALVALPSIAIPTAKAQIIHNSPDTAARFVDIYLNENKIGDNVEFRTATAYLDVQAGIPFVVSVSDSSSTDTITALFQKTFNLMAGQSYQVIAEGIVSAAGYTPNQAFDLNALVSARRASSADSLVDLVVYHGATDAPTVDVFEKLLDSTLVNDISYSEFSSYLTLDTGTYSIQVRNQANTRILAAYSAPLSSLGLGGQAITVLASGFIDPSTNSNGPAFGLWVADSSGGPLVALPTQAIEVARLQLIHNSADSALSNIDVYINGQQLYPNVAFRTATPYFEIQLDLPQDLTIVAAGESLSNPIFTTTYDLGSDTTYQLIASGISSTSGYSPRKPFNVDIFANARETGSNPNRTDLLVYHGSTDAPTIVDVFNLTGTAGTLVNDISYGTFQGYLTLDTLDYSIQVRNQANSDILAAYLAPLDQLDLQGQALTVLASGFSNPSVNSNGAPFGLWVATAAGGNLIELPAQTIPTAKVQVIHNSADAVASRVDVWLNNQRLVNNMDFRTATQYVTVDAGLNIDLSVTASNRNDTNVTFVKNTVNLIPGQTYQVIAAGIRDTAKYNPKPPFALHILSNARQAANAQSTDVVVYHGSTDAPAIDLVEKLTTNDAVLANALSYSQFSNYTNLSLADHNFSLINDGTDTEIALYDAPFNIYGLDGFAVTVLASGFANSSVNNNGPLLGLFVSDSLGGQLIQLNLITSLIENNKAVTNDISVYPNPSNGMISIDSKNISGNAYAIEVFDLNGKTVYSNMHSLPITNQIDLTSLSKGTYLIRFSSADSFELKKIILK